MSAPTANRRRPAVRRFPAAGPHLRPRRPAPSGLWRFPALRRHRSGEWNPAGGGPRRRRPAGERGSGTVLVLGVIGVLLALAVGVAALIRAQAAAGRARLAADLAALGGATALNSITAPADPCAVAGGVARANGAALSSCAVTGEDVVVEAAVRVQVLGVDRTATAAARAGPVDAPGPGP